MNSKQRITVGFGVLLVILILFLINGNPSPEPVMTEMDGSTVKVVKREKMPEQLHPLVEINKNKLIERSAKKGIEIVITDGFRSVEEQRALYKQGRSEEGNVVTNAKGGNSYHNYGLAIDFALLNEDGEAIWDMEYDGNDNDRSDWTEVVEIAKDLGFEWGGDWNNFPDYPHLQMTFGLRISQLKRGFWPAVSTEEV